MQSVTAQLHNSDGDNNVLDWCPSVGVQELIKLDWNSQDLLKAAALTIEIPRLFSKLLRLHVA